MASDVSGIPRKNFVTVKAAPRFFAPQDDPRYILNGDGQGRDYHSMFITGADSAGTPQTGWAWYPELSYRFGVYYTEAGHNSDPNGNGGRTGQFKDSAKISHRGQGDVGWFYGGFYYNGVVDPAITTVLAGPALVFLGGQFGTSQDHTYFNPVELDFDDRYLGVGKECAAAGYVCNYYRSNDLATKKHFWFHQRSQSWGPKGIDVVYSHTGRTKIVLDCAFANLDTVGYEQAAITLADKQRVYWDALPEDDSGYSRFPKLTHKTHTAYDSDVGGVVTTVNNVASFVVREGAFGPVTPPTITGSRSDGTALADLLTKLAAMGLVIDGTTA